MMLRIGSLFSGYGGLDMAIEAVLSARTAWVSDIDKGACKVLAHRYPDVPNLGDITTIDWATVEPVDIITGGSPCQDLSTAGARAGMTDGTRSNLWVQMREAIAHVQPTYVVWENVRGAFSAHAASDLEHCTGCMGDPAHRGPFLRALGRVLGDLSSLGYDTQWRGVRASDVGACHQRFRVFVLAWRRDLADTPLIRRQRRGSTWLGRPGLEDGHLADDLALLPTPRASEADHPGRVAANHAGQTGLAEAMNSLALLPTPKAGDAQFALPRTSGRPPEKAGFLATRLHYTDFDLYAAAVARQEAAFGYPAPSPTEPGKNRPHLSARFVEWMMGLPAGWITDVPGVTRTEALRALGNGVVPQQAAAALADMLAAMRQAVAA